MQIDWRLYGVAAAILAVLFTWFYLAKRDIEIHEGKDVQHLLDVTNLSDDEHYAIQAKGYVADLEKRRKIKLTSKQRKRAIEIYQKALHDHMHTWIGDRIDAKSSTDTRAEQSKVWSKANAEFEAMLKETAEPAK